MTRIVLVLAFGLLMEAMGVVLISKGQKALQTRFEPRPAVVWTLAREALSSRPLMLGVAFEAGFFGCLLFLLSRADVSLVWPLTSLSLVVTTLTARWVLHEHVSGLRWAGVGFILLGACIVLYTEGQGRRGVPGRPPGDAGASTVPRGQAAAADRAASRP